MLRAAVTRIPLRATAVPSRQFSSTALNLAVQVRKSFNKKSVYDSSSKSRKGSGNDKRFTNALVSSNYKRTAKDKTDIYEKLPVLNLEQLENNQIVRYQGDALRKMYIAGSFLPGQFNEIFPRPTTLIRERETQEMLKLYQAGLTSSSEKNRLILTGATGSGKSTTLSQFHAMALSQDSVLIPITNPDLLVNGSTDFKYNPELKLFDQQMSSKRILKKLRNLNKEALSQIPLSKDFVPLYNTKKQQATTTIKSTDPEATLLKLVELGLSQPTNATFVLTTLLDELSKQSQFPVFLTIDNFSTFVQNAKTKYRSTNDNPIYFMNFTIIKSLLDFSIGNKKFTNGAVVLATHGAHKENYTIPAAIGTESPDYYAKFADWDQHFTELLRSNGGLAHLEIGKLNVAEIESVLKNLFQFDVVFNDYQSGVDVAVGGVNQEGFDVYLKTLAQRKYIVSGNGNAKLLLKSCIMSYA